MSETKMNCTPKVIFDSRTAKSTYKQYSYYRSAAFDVPAGYVAVIELTTHKDYLENLTFTAIRIPADSPSNECFEKKGIGKRFRRWRCCQSLGSNVSPNGQPTAFTDFNKSIVRWGWDSANEELVEFEYINRPGRYYLMGDKCNNEEIEDCDNPTIFEVTMIPVDHISDLQLGCCD